MQIVGLDTKKNQHVSLEQLTLEGGRTARVDFVGRRADALFEKDAAIVAAIVSYDESTESITAYAPYQLKVNGVLQPGG